MILSLRQPTGKLSVSRRIRLTSIRAVSCPITREFAAIGRMSCSPAILLLSGGTGDDYAGGAGKVGGSCENVFGTYSRVRGCFIKRPRRGRRAAGGAGW